MAWAARKIKACLYGGLSVCLSVCLSVIAAHRRRSDVRPHSVLNMYSESDPTERGQQSDALFPLRQRSGRGRGRGAAVSPFFCSSLLLG